MDKNLIGLISGIGIPVLILLAIMQVNYQQGGMESVWKGWYGGTTMMGNYVIPIAIMMLIAGQMAAIAETHSAKVNEFLSGAHGIWGAYGIGIVIPNMSGYAQVDKLWSDGGTALRIALVGFFISSRMLNLQTSLFFLPILGWRLSGIMYGVCLCIGILCTTAIQLISLMLPEPS